MTALRRTPALAVAGLLAVAAAWSAPVLARHPTAGTSASPTPIETPASLPPTGRWQASLAAEDFVAAGIDAQDAPGHAAEYSWTFEGPRATLELLHPDGWQGSCDATMSVVEDRVRVEYDAGGDCDGLVQEITWRLEADGLRLHLAATNSEIDWLRVALEAKAFAAAQDGGPAASPSAVPSLGTSPAGTPATLPPSGTWQVHLGKADLAASGAADSGVSPGTYTWTFAGADARIDVTTDDGGSGYCEATMTVASDTVVFDYDPSGQCGAERDEIRWRQDPDGLRFTLVTTTAPFEVNRAYLETKPWQPVGTGSPAPSLATMGQAADDGARIVAVDTVDTRMRDLTIESPSVGTVTVRLLLPAASGADPSTAYPVLYLLHGAGGDHAEWTDNTDVEALTAATDLLVVMPDANVHDQEGWYTDWFNDGPGGAPAWETFHLTELRQLLERNWQAGDRRAIAGLSMGGYGAIVYAAHRPDLFKAAASYSGALDLQAHEGDFTGPLSIQRWGDPTTDAANRERQDPVKLVNDLKGIPLYIAYGNGEQGPFDPAGTAKDDLEEWTRDTNEAFVTALKDAGIPASVDAYGPGTHSWPYWERGLHASFPMLLEALGETPDPSPAG